MEDLEAYGSPPLREPPPILIKNGITMCFSLFFTIKIQHDQLQIHILFLSPDGDSETYLVSDRK